MGTRKERVWAYLDAEVAEKVNRLATLRRRTVSDTIAYLSVRGLERETETEMAQMVRTVGTCAEQIEQLQAVTESLESREAERFRLFLGHLQQHQAITTELLHLQRLMFMDERASAYAKVIESAREQVAEDAKVFRSSLASGGAARRVLSAKGSGKAA